jgi:hypothetical protein
VISKHPHLLHLESQLLPPPPPPPPPPLSIIFPRTFKTSLIRLVVADLLTLRHCINQTLSILPSSLSGGAGPDQQRQRKAVRARRGIRDTSFVASIRRCAFCPPASLRGDPTYQAPKTWRVDYIDPLSPRCDEAVRHSYPLGLQYPDCQLDSTYYLGAETCIDALSSHYRYNHFSPTLSNLLHDFPACSIPPSI